MYTIADLLKSDDIKEIKLVAGAEGVGNRISCTNIMDNPDTFDWLASGEFLLSTGYIFKDDKELQRKIVRRLSEIGCSGLGIKIQRYLTRFPSCMIEEAEALNFPLVQLPFGYSLSNISSLVNKNIDRSGRDRLEQALVIHRDLARATLKSGRLREITRIAVGYLNNPILIFDSNWRLLSVEDCPQNPIPVGEALSIRLKTAVLPKDFTDSMPGTLEQFRKTITRQLYLQDGGNVICRIMPVPASDNGVYGYILVWETVRTLDDTDYIALDQVALSVAIERLRTRELEELKVKIKRDFFDDLLSGNIESMAAIRSLAELHGFNLKSRYCCMLIRFDWKNSAERLLHQRQLSIQSDRCTEVCKRIAKDSDMSVICIPHSSQTILLVEAAGDEEQSDKKIHRLALNLYQSLSPCFSKDTLVIVIGAAADITQLSDAFGDVQQTMKLLRESSLKQPIFSVKDYGVLHLLDKNIDRQRLSAFAHRCLGRLLAYDRENGTQLMRTLDTYFAMSGNITEGAKRMFVHRNTYIYRLDKIKDLLKDDFSHPARLLEYQVALLALKITSE